MIKFLSLFSGIGAPEQALKNIGIKYELIGFSEIDKFAVKSYCNVHDVSESLNLGDITKIDISGLPMDIDLITHGSPCTSFSTAGKQAGGDKGSGTPSSLMWNTVDIVEHCRPKVVLWENVKNLLSKKHKHNFDGYLEVMEQMGYNNYYQVLNAKDYGIPQNRERIFTVSIRKDVDEGYLFPEPQELTLRLKDMLEDEVDEKYNINTCKIQQLFENVGGKLDLSKQVIGTCHKNNNLSRSTRDIVYNAEKNAPTLNATMYKDAPKILEPLLTETYEGYKVRVANKQGYQIAMEGDGIDLEQPNSKTRRGRVQKQSVGTLNTAPNKAVVIKVGQVSSNGSQAGLVYSSEGISQTLCAGTHGYAMGNIVDQFRVRKLTPRECWRLMGFTDEQFNKVAEVCSNTQLYKQAGNSIVVNVLEEIFKNLSILNR